MKKLFQIGVLILFIAGFCSVQLGYGTSMLVDDDVGVEFVTNNDVSDDAILTVIIENPGQVAAPLKYPLVNSEVTSISKETQICSIVSNSYIIDNILYQMALQDIQGNIPEKQLTSKDEQTGVILTNQIEGLFRLDIGENLYSENLI